MPIVTRESDGNYEFQRLVSRERDGNYEWVRAVTRESDGFYEWDLPGGSLYLVDDREDYARAFDLQGNRQASRDIDLDIGARGGHDWHAAGATPTRLLFYNAASIRVGTSFFSYINIWDRSGNRMAPEDIQVPNSRFTGMAVTPTKIVLVDNSSSAGRILLREMNHDGSGSRGLLLSNRGDFQRYVFEGATATSDRILLLDNRNFVIRSLNHDLSISSFAIWARYTGQAQAMFSTNDRVFIVKRTGAIEAYDHSGNRQAGDDFTVPTNIGTTSSNIWRGAVAL